MDRVSTPDGYVFSLPPNMHLADIWRLVSGRYERCETTLLREYFQGGKSIIDLGSNIGFIARKAYNTKLSAGGHMICVEPNPVSFPSLRQNMNRSISSDRQVTFINAAVGKKANDNGTSDFILRNRLSSALTACTKQHRRDHRNIIQVPVLSLAEIVNKITTPYSLIMDVEGGECDIVHEYNTLQGCAEILAELHDSSFTGRKETPDIMAGQIKDQGFSLEAQSGNCYYFRRPEVL